MGRAKLNMELISKEKSRNVTFKKRKEGLIRKMHEFTTLCDVSACMIIYGPKSEKEKTGSNEPEIWPQNIEEIHRIIEIYKSKKKDSGNKTFGLSDFFHDRKRKIEEELSKIRKKKMESKYPTWLDFMNSLPEENLREFSSGLSVKYENIKSRIESLKRNRDMSFMDFAHSRMMNSQSHHSAFYTPAAMRGVELEIINQPIEMHLPMYNSNSALDHHQESMMMLLMNDNDQFGGGPTGGNISFKRHVYYESTSAGRGVVDPMGVSHSPRPLARLYAPPVVPPYMGTMPPVVPPQMQLPARESHVDSDEEQIVQYQMKNNRGRYFE